MKEEHSYCIGCDKGFYLTDKNSGPTIGSPEYCTLCHKRCCGNDTRCKKCSIYIEKIKVMEKRALKSLLNIVVIAIQQMDSEMLHALQNKDINISSLIGAELDKRDNIVTSYAWTVNSEGKIVVSIQ